MRWVVTGLLGAVAGLVTVLPAKASTLTASTILQDFNAVIYNNASTPSDIEGAAVIGGNFSGATVYNNPSASQPTGFGALTVFGNTSGNTININNRGNAYVGGTRGAAISFNGGGYIAAPPNTISDFETPLNSLSQSLSQLAPTGTLPPTGNNEVITATPGANGVAVLDITAAALAAIPSFSINLNGASSVIINVNGSSANFNANDESGTNGANHIIWNFYDATGTVALNTLIGGTVLATGATVTNANQIDGALVADNWTGSGELHDWAFDGALPEVPAPGVVTEPSAMGVFGVGVAALALLSIRRRRDRGGANS
jgi:choice-of-anchor A domain-containing protein